MKKVILFLFISLIYTYTYSQVEVKGKIVDESNVNLPGVFITVNNSSKSAVSDVSGNFIITVNPTDTLIFSMLGMTVQKVAVNGKNTLNVQMVSELQKIEEVVVVGYGTQKAKDLTSPIVVLKNDAIENQATSTPTEALQGRVAGVQIINNNGGTPGANSTIEIRGVGSIGNYSQPLFVVDGVFVNNIDFLSNNDIEEITILKDASAAAIYGVKAANGVVMVTTKKGTPGRPPSITYEGYIGAQVPVNIMALTNTTQYVTLQNEANTGIPGNVPLTVSQFHGANTNWYNALLRNAFMQYHSLELSGATDKTSYSFGVNYLYQNGIQNANNNFTRLNLRAKSDHKLSENASVGFSAVISSHTTANPNTNAFYQAYINPPIYNVYDTSNHVAYPVSFGSPQSAGLGNEFGNPVAFAYYNNDNVTGYTLIPSIYLELNFLHKKLSFKSQLNENLNYSMENNYTPQYYVSGSQGVTASNLTKTYQDSSKQIFDNTLTYKDTYNKKHVVSIMIGTSTLIEKSNYLQGSAINVPGFNEQSEYLVNGSFNNRYANDGGSLYNELSYFTRGTYSYNGKYLATLTLGLTEVQSFSKNGVFFPSAGLGWELSKEPFMKSQHLFQDLKFRASWGLLGNDNVPANSAVIVGTSGAASSGIFGGTLVPGIGAQTVYQNYLKWEVVNEFDAGFDFIMLQNLKGNVDFYSRTTNNVVFSAPIASGGGVATLLGNNGSVNNMGVELALNWSNKVSDKLSFTVGMNLTYLQNKVVSINGYGNNGYLPGSTSVNGVFATRAVVGKPIGSFYGYKVSGVYQTITQIYQDLTAPSWAQPGFLKYVDVAHQGTINTNDITYLGSPIPWLLGGVNFGMTYSRIDFSVAFQGQVGNKILNEKRMNKTVFPSSNYDLDFYEHRWHGEGTSNTYPSAAAMVNSNILQPNSFFAEDGSYVRIQNIQIGYTIPSVIVQGIKFPKIRIYVSAERPLTLTNYKGFTPEIGGSDPNDMGIDNNAVYPMQGIYTFGVKAIF